MPEIKKTLTQKLGFAGGIIIFFVLLLIDFAPDNPKAGLMAATAGLMAVFWMTEAIPLAATALIPLILFPLLGVLSGKDTAGLFFNSTIFLFIGGFFIALAMEKWQLHKRISLVIVRKVGSKPGRLVLGFMLSSMLLSMFISNTATAIMMLPIGLAIILKLEESFTKDNVHTFSVAVMLGIAYGASAGGIATLVGTPPNLAFRQIFHITFPDAPVVTFGNWFIMAFPIVVIMVIIIWLLLTKILFRANEKIKIDKSIIREEYRQLGKIKFEEKAVLYVLITTALLWIFKNRLVLGFMEIPGWSELHPYASMIDDGTVAIMASIFLFIIPTKTEAAKNDSPTLLTNDVFSKLPWDIILLFGGGFALAKGFQESGLSELIGNYFTAFGGIDPFLMIVLICLFITFLTELTSNTATTQTILPIFASIAISLQINPLLLMIPATISASYAFMLPVATPPNAIAFSSGRISIGEMVKAGIIINLIGVIVTSTMFYFIGRHIFNIDITTFPIWGNIN